MGLEWLWQGVVSNLVFWVLIGAGGAMLAYLGATSSRWFVPLLFGLVGCALVAVILYASAGLMSLAKQQPQTTLENVETNIRTWIDAFGMTVRRETDAESHFSFFVMMHNGVRLYVKRLKELGRYIMIESTLNILPEHESILQKLSDEQAARIINELVLEIARLNFEWDILDKPLRSIRLIKYVPITTSLTEDVFAERLHAMTSAHILVQTRLDLSLNANR